MALIPQSNHDNLELMKWLVYAIFALVGFLMMLKLLGAL